MKARLTLVLLVTLAAGSVPQAAVAVDNAFTRAIDPVIDALWSRFDMTAAMDHVKFVGEYWRLPGNPGYDATLDRVKARILASGFPAKDVSFDEYNPAGRSWDYSVGTVALVRPGQSDEVVLSKETHHIALCINSFSTADGGVVAPVVDVGRGTEADYAGKDVKGAVVLGDAAPGGLWTSAVVNRGAIGVISTTLANYISPDFPGAPATPRDQWDILQWASINYDEARKGFAFKSSPRAAATLRKAIAAAGAGAKPSVHVTIKSAFYTKPTRTLIAEIPGASAPSERVVLVAHVQEPGANDNASGVATLTELARAMIRGIHDGKIPPPARTITFMWLNEIAGSRQWLQMHAADAKLVKYMMSMDMTGEDVKKTGGTFLIERWPDPGAVYDRPWDPHSEWGRGNVRADSLKGDLLNDMHLAVCNRVAAKTDWVVKSNPYEGGSDHTQFGQAGIPSLLNWHFTDRYYHSSFDTPDKTSPAEMRNVGVSVAASAWLLASAKESTALAVADVVAAAGKARIAVEETEGAKLAAAATVLDPTAAKARETTIVQAWRKWYGEAVHSVSRLVNGPVTAAFEQKLEQLAAGLAKPATAYHQ